MLSLNIGQSRSSFLDEHAPFVEDLFDVNRGGFCPPMRGVRREGFLMAQWGLAKPRLYARPPAEQCHLDAENAAERPFFGTRPFFLE
jgi:hypothetical protein